MGKAQGVGASIPRKEDDRYTRGRGEFIADIRLARMRDVAFVRSPVAHARLNGVRIPDTIAADVFDAAKLTDARPILARSGLPGFKISEQPVLASEHIRYVGELIAACVADSRAAAEDLAEQVALDLVPLPPVTDMLAARSDDAALLHEQWGDNVFLESFVDADLSGYEAQAAVSVTRTFRTAR